MSVDPGPLGGQVSRRGERWRRGVQSAPSAGRARRVVHRRQRLGSVRHRRRHPKVPVLTAWCGVPMRVAAATSSLMIGVTAVASAPIQYANGYINPPLAAAAVLGVLIGSRGGLWFGARARVEVAEADDGASCCSSSASFICGEPCESRSAPRLNGSRFISAACW